MKEHPDSEESTKCSNKTNYSSEQPLKNQRLPILPLSATPPTRQRLGSCDVRSTVLGGPPPGSQFCSREFGHHARHVFLWRPSMSKATLPSSFHLGYDIDFFVHLHKLEIQVLPFRILVALIGGLAHGVPILDLKRCPPSAGSHIGSVDERAQRTCLSFPNRQRVHPFPDGRGSKLKLKLTTLITSEFILLFATGSFFSPCLRLQQSLQKFIVCSSLPTSQMQRQSAETFFSSAACHT